MFLQGQKKNNPNENFTLRFKSSSFNKPIE